MSVSDADWMLLEKRLESIERSIEILEKMFIVENVRLEPEADYVLYQGSLQYPSTEQIWRNKDES